MAMVADLDEDVVDFVPNYDNQLLQPSVLPAAIPHLLVNGASGIAVGMATNMAPHNLGEVVEALRHLIDHPDAALESLMAFLPGPDLPTGGTIVGLEGITEAYETGRGSFKTRATVSVENVGPRKTGLVITELPYLVGPERVIDKIKDAVNSKKLTGISDVTDLTDRHNGLRLVISLKSGFDPQAVLAELYRLTPLEENFSINSVALVNGQPQTLGLKELLEVFLEHRVAVVTRRSVFRLDQKTQRLHLVEGLLIAMTDIDQVIQVIRSSDDVAAARTRLQEVFSLSLEQTDYILELRLRRLTRMSTIELETERDALREQIAHLKALLADSELIRRTVSDELAAMSEAYGTPRRSVLSGATAPVARAKPTVANLEITDAPCDVLVSASGKAARVVWPEGAVPGPSSRSAHDALLARTSSRLRGSLGALTSAGNMHVFQPMDLPELDPTRPQLAEGVSLHEFLGLGQSDGTIVGVVSLDDSPTVMLGTAAGIVKRVSLSGLPEKTHHNLIALKDGDTVVGAGIAGDDTHCVFITSTGQLLHFPATAVRPQGPSASGMAGIALGEGAGVMWAGALSPKDATVITVSGSSQVLPGTEAVRIKRTPLAEFPSKGRATGGVRAHTFLKGEDVLVRAFVGKTPLALGSKGVPLELDLPEAKRDASGALAPESPEAFGEALA
jgi:DNA gyrase subunit A